MSLKFTVVARKNLSKGAPEDSKLFYAQARQMGTVGIDELCDEIAETCTLTSADLKCALDRLAWSIAKHAKEGRSVQVGELGTFRMSISSKGVETEEQMNATLIRKANLLFYPGKRLRSARKEARFEKFVAKKEEQKAGGGGNESPGA